MAFVKTTFVNGQAPALSAEELNKMGQGIEDILKDGVAYSHDTRITEYASTWSIPLARNNTYRTLGTHTFTRKNGYKQLRITTTNLRLSSGGSSGASNPNMRIYVNNLLVVQGGSVAGADAINLDVTIDLDLYAAVDSNITVRVDGYDSSANSTSYSNLYTTVDFYRNEIWKLS